MIRKNVTFDGNNNKINVDSNNLSFINTPIAESKSMGNDPYVSEPANTPIPQQPSLSSKKKPDGKVADSTNKKLERHTIVELKIDNDTSLFDGTVAQKLNQKQTKESMNVKVNKDSIDFVFIFLKTYDILLKKETN